MPRAWLLPWLRDRDEQRLLHVERGSLQRGEVDESAEPRRPAAPLTVLDQQCDRLHRAVQLLDGRLVKREVATRFVVEVVLLQGLPATKHFPCR